MQNIFNSVFFPKVNTNVFDLSHDVKLSLNMGDLVPSMIQEVIPGDKFSVSTESLLRFAPLISPVMHKVDVYQHFFFVPNRILWSGWKDFITDKAPVPAAPHITGATFTRGTLGDYLGLPTDVNIDKVSALPFAAYQAIYHEYYRDQNLVTEFDYKVIDGPHSAGGTTGTMLRTMRKRAWQHDYFTAALPFAQKGTAVTLPMTGNFQDVPVSFNYTGGTLGTTVLTGSGEDPTVTQGSMSGGTPNQLFADTST